MASFNKVILMGNLTRDPELRYTPNGAPVAQLGLAVSRNWRTDQGEQREEVAFIDIDVFGRTAENVSQYMRKGRPILIEGRLKFDQWEDRNTGQKRSKLKVIAETVQFLGSRDDNRGGGGYQDGGDGSGGNSGNYGGGGGGGGGSYNEPPANQSPPSSPRPAPAPYDDGPPPDDDVPF